MSQKTKRSLGLFGGPLVAVALMFATVASQWGQSRADVGMPVPNFSTLLNQPVVDVRLLGAKCDGVTDDLAAVNLAIAKCNAAGGGVVLFPPSTTRVKLTGSTGFVVARSNVTLKGQGPPSKLQVDPTSGNFEALISTPQVGGTGSIGVTAISNFAVEDLTIDMNPTGNTGATPVVGNSSTAQYAIKFNVSSGVRVRRVRFAPCTGINTVVIYGTDARVTDCYFQFVPRVAPASYDNSAVYIEAQDYQVTNNTFETAQGSGARAAVEIHDFGGVCSANASNWFQTLVNVVTSATVPADVEHTGHTVSGNTVNNCTAGISLWPGHVRAGFNAQAGTFNTITLDTGASAVNGLYVGLDVYLPSGTGAGQRRRITSYDGATRLATVDQNWDVVPDATSVFNVHHTMRGVSVTGNTINVSQVSHNTNSSRGINVVWDSNTRGAVEGLVVSGNTIMYQPEPGGRSIQFEYLEAGIMLTPYSNECIGATVTGNTIIRAPGPGIRPCGTVAGSRLRASRIANNLIIDAGQCPTFAVTAYRAGLFLDAPIADTVIENNSIIDTGVSALRGVYAIYTVAGHSNLRVRHNPVMCSAPTPLAMNGLNSSGLWGEYQAEVASVSGAVTPNPALGRVKRWTLGGNVTVNPISAANRVIGERITFEFIQDPTGGRSVTFNAAYKAKSFNLDTAPNAVSRITFEDDGTSFQQESTSQPLPATATVSGTTVIASGGAVGTSYKANAWLFPALSPGTGAVANGVMSAARVGVPEATSITSIAAEVTIAGSAGSVIRLGVYNDNGHGYPGTLLVDAGTIDGTVVGVASIPFDGLSGHPSAVVTAAGTYWIVGVSQGAPVTNPTVRINSGVSSGILFGSAAAGMGSNATSYTMAGVTAALPGTFNATVSATTNTHRVAVQLQ
jgi:hypothetical protein